MGRGETCDLRGDKQKVNQRKASVWVTGRQMGRDFVELDFLRKELIERQIVFLRAVGRLESPRNSSEKSPIIEQYG